MKQLQPQLLAAARAASRLRHRKEALRKFEIPWDSYASGGLISAEELALVKTYNNSDRDRIWLEVLFVMFIPFRGTVVCADARVTPTIGAQNGPVYVSLFLTLAARLRSPDTTAAILTRLTDVIDDDPQRRLLFLFAGDVVCVRGCLCVGNGLRMRRSAAAVQMQQPDLPYGPLLEIATSGTPLVASLVSDLFKQLLDVRVLSPRACL